MKYKIMVFDLDGTLTNSEKKITPYTKEVLLRYQQSGGRVVLASGRPTYGVAPLEEELSLDRYGGFLLSFNGGMITDCRTGKAVYESSLNQEAVRRICDLSVEHGTALVSYQDEWLITEQPDDFYILKESSINHMEIKKVESLVDYITFPVTKCLMTANSHHLAQVEPKVREALGTRFSVYRSEPYFLEIMPENIDKAASLQRLLNILKMNRESLAAFGDGFNDKSMLAFAGLGVAMRNAQEAVKAVADCVTLSNDNEGVAYMVNKLMEEEAE